MIDCDDFDDLRWFNKISRWCFMMIHDSGLLLGTPLSTSSLQGGQSSTVHGYPSGIKHDWEIPDHNAYNWRFHGRIIQLCPSKWQQNIAKPWGPKGNVSGFGSSDWNLLSRYRTERLGRSLKVGPEVAFIGKYAFWSSQNSPKIRQNPILGRKKTTQRSHDPDFEI